MTERILLTGASGFIGSHLIEVMERADVELLNLDLAPPALEQQRQHWQQCDITNTDELAKVFRNFRPTRVIHLAAKASLRGEAISDFPENVIGTRNVVACVNGTDTVQLLVNTSTQYVVRPGIVPRNEEHLEPYTAYGASKAMAERIVREECHKPWSTLRPTNVWGPRHPYFPYELWKYLERRFYVHPGFKPIQKYYGYVENVAYQMFSIAIAPEPEAVAGTVRYVTDAPMDNAEWMNGFSIALSGRPVRRVPLVGWRVAALAGDVVASLGARAPVNSDRLFRLTVNEVLPEGLRVVMPEDRIVSLQEGIERCVFWYRDADETRRARR